MKIHLPALSGLVMTALLPLAAQAATYGGVDFPAGAISFADAVVSYDLPPAADAPNAANSVAAHALGAPDYVSGGACTNAATCTFASLGNGGSITVRFTDNHLTGSGNAQEDLHVFEVGPSVEAMTVEVSADGSKWTPVGTVAGSTAGVDLDAFGFDKSSRLAYVRLTDVYVDNYGPGGGSAGADVDAIGAISTVAAVPEPGSWAMLLAGLLGVGLAAGRRRAGD
jgi:hypothetical protein